MDPLSISASVAGLITITDVIVRNGYKFLRDVRQAEQSVADLIAEVNKLAGTLYSLRNVVKRFETDVISFEPASQVRHIEACFQTLQKIQVTLDNAIPSSSKGRLEKLERKLRWPLSASETKGLIVEVERHTSTLHLALSADGMSALLVALARQDATHAVVSDIKKGLDQDRAQRKLIMMSEEREKILRSLGPVDPARYHQNNSRLRQPGTGMWFIQSPEYQSWLKESESRLWLQGIPGAGKTILTSLIIQETQRIAGAESGFAYYYCDYKDPETQNPKNILGSLLKQLATQDEQCFVELETYYKKDKNFAVDATLESLIGIFYLMTSKFDETFVVIDALDEVGESRHIIIDQLRALCLLNSNLKILLTSRKEIDIEHAFSDFVEVSIAAQSSDIRLYVASEIEVRIQQKRLWIRSPSLKEHILKQLVDRADGMFRWVACQMDYLCELNNDRARRKALDELPRGLRATYERILLRVSETNASNITLVKRTLHWILGAKGGLTTSALLEALAIEPGDSLIDYESMTSENDILHWCGSLVRRNEDSQGLELAHFSVKEFLLSIEDDTSSPLREYAFSSTAQMDLAVTCLTALNFGPPEDGALPKVDTLAQIREFVQSNPFLVCAAEYWPDHGRPFLTHEGLLDLACQLHESASSHAFLRYLFLLIMTWSADEDKESREDRITEYQMPLCFAALFSLQPLVARLIEDCPVTTGIILGEALKAAMSLFVNDSYNRRAQLYRETGFLHFKPSPSFLTNTANNVLVYAKSAKETVEFLLSVGAKFIQSPTPNRRISKLGESDIMEFLGVIEEDYTITGRLIDADLKLSTQDLSYVNDQLSGTSKVPPNWRHLVEMAKEENIEPNARDTFLAISLSFKSKGKPMILDRGPTSVISEKTLVDGCLQAATFGQFDGFSTTFEALKSLVDANKFTQISGQAFSKAAQAPHIAILEFLAKQDIDLKYIDEDGNTPLHNVLDSPFSNSLNVGIDKLRQLVQLLLRKGSDTSLANHQGEIPLHLAASHCGLSVLKALLESRDISAVKQELLQKTADGMTPLWNAVRRASDESALYLLEDQFSTNLADHRLRETGLLHRATRRTSPIILLRLIALGCDVNEIDAQDHSTPLHHAAKFGSLETFLILLQKGANISLHRKNTGGAMHIILGNVHDEGPAKLDALINAGGNINDTSGPKSSSPLQAALRVDTLNDIGLLQIRRLLKEEHIMIDYKDEDGLTAVMDTCRNLRNADDSPHNQKKIEVLRLLLKTGANACLQTSNGWTAMHFICDQFPSPQMFEGVRWLSDSGAPFHLKSIKGVSAFELLIARISRDETKAKSDASGNTGSESEGSRDSQDSQASVQDTFEEWLTTISFAIDHMTQEQLEEPLSGGLSPLSFAIHYSHLIHYNHSLTTWILDKVSSVDKKSYERDAAQDPLILACIHGCSTETARQLLLRTQRPVHAPLPYQEYDYEGAHLIHIAASSQKGLSMLEALIPSAPDIDVRDRRGSTALINAAEVRGKTGTKMVKMLLEAGADIEGVDESYGSTALLRAADESRWNTVRALIDAGANIDTLDPDSKRTVLHHASSEGSKSTREIILNRSPSINLEQEDSFGLTPLLLAIRGDHFSLVNFLLEKGARVRSSCPRGSIAHFAVFGDDNNIRETLISHSIDWNSSAADGTWKMPWELGNKASNKEAEIPDWAHQSNETDFSMAGLLPFHLAASRWGESLQFLADHDLLPENINVKTPSGLTALHISVKSDRTQVAKLLVKMGADVNATTPNMMTPLHIAAEDDLIQMAETLLDIGCDPDLQNKTGATALQWAHREKIWRVFNLLYNRFGIKDGVVPGLFDKAPFPSSTNLVNVGGTTLYRGEELYIVDRLEVPWSFFHDLLYFDGHGVVRSKNFEEIYPENRSDALSVFSDYTNYDGPNQFDIRKYEGRKPYRRFSVVPGKQCDVVPWSTLRRTKSFVMGD